MADAAGEPLIATPAGLRDLVAHLRDAGRFAFDTEFVSEETFEPVLGLIQVATRDRLAVVDPLAVGDLSPFWGVVTDPAIEVVMHAASEDLRICRFQTGTVPRRVFDVQIAAALVGYGYPLSLGNLVAQAMRVAMPGGETRTDWRRRPLSPAQLRYALDDVRYLLDLADRLAARARAPGPDRRGPRRSSRSSSRRSATAPRRIAGVACRACTTSAAAAWRSRAGWPNGGSRRPGAANRPLRQVMRDDLLVAIAKRQPASRRDLEALRDFNRPHLLGRASEILGVVAASREVPADELPDHAERHEEGPGLAMVVSLLAAALAHCCSQGRVAPTLVGSSYDLKGLIRWQAEGGRSRTAPRWPAAGAARSAARPCSTSSPAAAPSASSTRRPTCPSPWSRSRPTRRPTCPPDDRPNLKFEISNLKFFDEFGFQKS